MDKRSSIRVDRSNGRSGDTGPNRVVGVYGLLSGLCGCHDYRGRIFGRGKIDMSEDYWKKLTRRHEEMLHEEQQLEELLRDKTRQLKKSIKDKRSEIEALENRIEETRQSYQKGLKGQPLVQPGFYWGRNKHRANPDQYDMIIQVSEPTQHGIQEWYLMSPDIIGWTERQTDEYKLGEFIGEDRK